MGVQIDMVDLGRSVDFIPLTRTLEYFHRNRNLMTDNYALIPVGEIRQKEALGLGTPVAKTDTWYEIRYNGKNVMIFQKPISELPNFYLRGRVTLRKLRKLLKPLF